MSDVEACERQIRAARSIPAFFHSRFRFNNGGGCLGGCCNGIKRRSHRGGAGSGGLGPGCRPGRPHRQRGRAHAAYRASHDAGRSAARPARSYRHQNRLQPGRLLGLHGPARRRPRLLVHDAGHRGWHARRHHNRGAGPWRDAPSGAGCLYRARRRSVRILYARHGYELRGPPRAHAGAYRGGGQSRVERALLPLRHLSPCDLRDARGSQSAKGLTMATDETSTGTFPFGIAGAGLSEVQRQIPADEPPPLPPNAELAVIGKPVPRQNGRAKVTGAIRYTVDISLPGMLHARILRSAQPHAEIRAVDTAASSRHPGVSAVLAVVQPGGVVRYIGAPIAAVAATSMAAAEEALRLIRVDYKPLPFVADMYQALDARAPLVYDAASAPKGHPSGWPAPPDIPLVGNVRGPAGAKRGEVAQGFAQAEIVAEGEYRTHVQTHCCAEPHGIVADWRADGLTVYMSTQYTAGVRHELAENFGLPLNRVRVLVDGMGGGFGSKSSLGNYGRIAVSLSRQANAPVRLILTRQEEQMDSGNRPATWQRLRIGARRDGSLTEISLVSYGTAGVALGAGVGNVAEALYSCPNFEGAQHDVFINAGPGCAMRA